MLWYVMKIIIVKFIVDNIKKNKQKNLTVLCLQFLNNNQFAFTTSLYENKNRKMLLAQLLVFI